MNASVNPSGHSDSRESGPWILTATILGSSLVFIDGTVVNVALAALQSELKATAVDVQWVVEAYALLLSSLLLVGGSLSDKYGRKRVYMIGVLIFALTSAWCGIAPNIHQLILARGVQGIGAAILVPGSLSIITASFAKPDRGRAIGTWSGFSAVTTAVGPVIGGWLIEQESWRWIFFINLPLAVIVLVLTIHYVPEYRNPAAASAGQDWLGTILATVGLGGITYALIESSRRGLNNWTVIFTLSAGLLALVLFVFSERRHRTPLVPLGLFRSRNFSGANLLTLFLYGALIGSLFFFPLNLIQVQGYSATAAGAAFLPFILLMFLLSRWSGGLLDRYGAKLPLIVGPILAAVGFALFALPSEGGNYWTTFFPAVVVLGLGMAVCVAPLTTTVMNSVSEEQAGVASGINNAVSRVAGVIAIAALGIVMLGSFNDKLAEHLKKMDLPSHVIQQLNDQRIKLAAAEIPDEVDADTKAEVRKSINDSFVGGFRLVMIISSILAVASSACAWLIIESGTPLVVQARQVEADP